MTDSSPSTGEFRLSATLYFVCVAVLSALIVGAVMLVRPAFAYTVRSMLGLEKPPQATAGSFYLARVAPIFQEYCTECHGERKQKGNLRLDSYAGAVRGGKQGPMIAHGELANKELLDRLTLPSEDDRAMPPSGKPAPSTDEIKVIKLWIEAGASGTVPVAAIKGAPPPTVKIEFPKVDQTAVAREREPLAQAVKTLQAQLPGVLSYVSRGSADLQVNASLLGRAFGDEQFSALIPVRERIVWADFSGTSISDSLAPEFAGFKRLRTLRVANTGVADVTAQALRSVKSLRSLTVIGTSISESSVATLRSQGVRVYDGRE